MNTLTIKDLNLDSIPEESLADVSLIANNQRFFNLLGVSRYIQKSNEKEIIRIGFDKFGYFCIYADEKNKKVDIDSDEIIEVRVA